MDWITVQGFKSIKSVKRLELRPINILIGANGSGKSNFIEVFSFLNAVRRGRLRDYVEKAGGADRILHFGLRTTSRIEIHVSFENEGCQYRVVLAADETDRLFLLEEEAYFQGRWHSASPYTDFWRRYQFHDTSSVSSIKKTADINDNRYLRFDGSNLAAFLYLLREKHESSYDMIRRTVRLAVPFLDDFHLRPQVLNENKIRLEWRHVGSDACFDVSALSDG